MLIIMYDKLSCMISYIYIIRMMHTVVIDVNVINKICSGKFYSDGKKLINVSH